MEEKASSCMVFAHGPGYTSVSEKNRVHFNSESAAKEAGYRKAKNCT
jgi:hypothetical protein